MCVSGKHLWTSTSPSTCIDWQLIICSTHIWKLFPENKVCSGKSRLIIRLFFFLWIFFWIWISIFQTFANLQIYWGNAVINSFKGFHIWPPPFLSFCLHHKGGEWTLTIGSIVYVQMFSNVHTVHSSSAWVTRLELPARSWVPFFLNVIMCLSPPTSEYCFTAAAVTAFHWHYVQLYILEHYTQLEPKSIMIPNFE